MSIHVSPAKLKAAAIAQFEAALANPNADWRAVAETFAAAVNARTVRKPIDPNAPPTWWNDYRTSSRKSERAVVETRFEDGITVRTSALSLPNKGFNIGRALTLAITFYRLKNKDAQSVPPLASVTVPETSETFDVDECNRMTVALRLPLVELCPAPPTTGEISARIAVLETELERRKDMVKREAWKHADRSLLGGVMDPETFRATYFVAVTAAEKELVKLRARLDPQAPTEPETEAELLANAWLNLLTQSRV